MEKYKIAFIDESDSQWLSFKDNFEADFDVEHINPTSDITKSPEMYILDLLKSDIDILFIDFLMEEKVGYNWDTIEEILAKHNPYFPFLIVTSNVEDAFNNINNSLNVYSKTIWDQNHTDDLKNFKLQIKYLIENYRKNIIDKEVKLKELKQMDSIPQEFENEYIELNQFFAKLSGDDININNLTLESWKKLDKLLESTQNLLNELNKDV